MAKLPLKLVVAQYDQPKLDKNGEWDPRTGATKRWNRGDVFEANDQDEYDRLHEIGAALDPDKATAQEADKLRARLAELDAERAATEAKLSATDESAPPLNPDDLKGKELDDALEARGLSTDGKVEEKRQRLADRLSGNPENPTAHTGA